MKKNVRRILVSGGNRGIGYAIAKKLAEQEYEVHVIVSDNKSRVSLLSEKTFFLEEERVHSVDLSKFDSIIDFANRWEANLWGIVNNAGICKTLDLKSYTNDPIHEIISTNLLGPYYLTKYLLKYITSPGRIINISSQLGVEGRAGYSAYCASKFGLIGLTKCWAKELGIDSITVNAVCPGWVSTDMSMADISRIASERLISPEDLYTQICEPLELKRFNAPSEIANLVSFLLSNEAAGITGREFLMQTIWNQL